MYGLAQAGAAHVPLRQQRGRVLLYPHAPLERACVRFGSWWCANQGQPIGWCPFCGLQ